MSLSSRETNVLRGVAIILIVLHNVTHIFCPVQENEVGSVFVISSAYGLMAKYGGSRLKPFRWLGNHYLKLFLLMAPCLFLLFIVAKGMIGGEWELGLYFLEQTFLLVCGDGFPAICVLSSCEEAGHTLTGGLVDCLGGIPCLDARNRIYAA